MRKPISAEAFYFDIFAGVEEEAVRSGRHLLFSYLDDWDREEIETFNKFLEKVDGLVIEEARNPEFLDMIVSSRIPAVLIAPTATHAKLDIAYMDIAGGVQKACELFKESES